MQRKKTGIIYTVGYVYISTRGSATRGHAEGTDVEATKTRGGGDASPSHNPPRDYNISSLVIL